MSEALSVAIIAKDEETMLPECLSSVSFADDVVVVDSGSLDRTVEIAEKFGARVFTQEWLGEGRQRNRAANECAHDWILILDADERVPDEAREEIVRIISEPESADAYLFKRKNFFQGKWIRHCGWWPDEVIRLYKKSCCSIVDREVHLEIKVNGKTARSANPILHYPVRDLEAVLQKNNRYALLGAKDLYMAGKKGSVSKALIHSVAAFLKIYILKRGFLDGAEGLIIAFSVMVNTFYKYVKLRDLCRNGQR